MQSEIIESYKANGKLLLSGEYLVLAGAKALAIPLKYGQTLGVKNDDTCFLSWTAKNNGKHWFQASFDSSLNIVSSDQLPLAEDLAKILKVCIDYRPDIKELMENKSVTTELEFDKDWGWGSSSTLISLLSQWLGVHPYQLLKDTFGGSGYDIACATASSPIIYQLIDGIPKSERIQFNPSFAEKIYFVYSGQKQSSRKEIARFKQENLKTSDIALIDQLTEKMIRANNVDQFGNLMAEHEQIIGGIVQLNPIKNEQFNDFKGYIKTLGAWGGDFMMVACDESEEYVRKYFKAKQLNPIFKYNEIII